MSPRKLTEDDKQEILQQYRTSQATTSTLAKSYEVSSSTISRFLKNKLSSAEYEDLIQQKRLARTPRGEKSSTKASKTSTSKTKKAKSSTKSKPVETVLASEELPESVPTTPESVESTTVPEEPKPTLTRRRRRRTLEPEVAVTPAADEPETPVKLILDRQVSRDESEIPTATTLEPEVAVTPAADEPETPVKLILDRQVSRDEPEIPTATTLEPEVAVTPAADEPETPVKLILDRQVSRDEPEIPKRERLILRSDRVEPEDEDEDDALDLITLKEMLGEDLEDINDDEDDEDDEDWDEDEAESYSEKSSSISNIQILPLSQASFPRTCYLVIDRSAELIVKPLEDFADLGTIPDAEVRQSTLPVFDNHHIAKRFSHRRERVIKVPDGRMIQKTSHHLQDKGITRLLLDGQIYSL